MHLPFTFSTPLLFFVSLLFSEVWSIDRLLRMLLLLPFRLCTHSFHLTGPFLTPRLTLGLRKETHKSNNAFLWPAYGPLGMLTLSFPLRANRILATTIPSIPFRLFLKALLSEPNCPLWRTSVYGFLCIALSPSHIFPLRLTFHSSQFFCFKPAIPSISLR